MDEVKILLNHPFTVFLGHWYTILAIGIDIRWFWNGFGHCRGVRKTSICENFEPNLSPSYLIRLLARASYLRYGVQYPRTYCTVDTFTKSPGWSDPESILRLFVIRFASFVHGQSSLRRALASAPFACCFEPAVGIRNARWSFFCNKVALLTISGSEWMRIIAYK